MAIEKAKHNDHLAELMLEAAKYARAYSETRDAGIMGDQTNPVLLAEKLESYTGSWETNIHTTKTIFKHNEDKPHRCPVCHTIPDELWKTGSKTRRWRIYTCRFGHRFSMLPLITKEYEYVPMEEWYEPKS